MVHNDYKFKKSLILLLHFLTCFSRFSTFDFPHLLVRELFACTRTYIHLLAHTYAHARAYVHEIGLHQFLKMAPSIFDGKLPTV